MTAPDSNPPPDIMDAALELQQLLDQLLEQRHAKDMEDDLAREEAIAEERRQELLQQEQRRQLEMDE